MSRFHVLRFCAVLVAGQASLFTAGSACAEGAPTAVPAALMSTAAPAVRPAVSLPGTAPAAPPLAALTVDDILARHARARGGAPAWRAVQGLTFTGLLDAGRAQVLPDARFANPGASARERRRIRIERERSEAATAMIQLPFRLELARGRKSRMEVHLRDQTAVQVFDGQAGWKLRPFLEASHRLQPFNATELKLAADQADVDGWLIDPAAKGVQVAVAGQDLVDQRPAYRLKVTLATGDVRHVWVDGETFLDVQVEGQRPFNGQLRAMYTVLKDWRQVGAVWVPFLMETRMEGFRETERLQIESATLNPAPADERFARPS